MTKNSSIEWTHHTFNPWWGCTKVSAGCTHCYAEALSNRWRKAEWGPRGVRIRTSEANWREPLKWNRKAGAAGVRERVFCASMADVFEHKPDQPELDDWRRDLFRMIVKTPHLDWLLLTKRPHLVNETIERVTGFSDSEMWFAGARNVWIGTSVESQETADERIPHLLHIPASVRFLSMEPLLESVDLTEIVCYPSESDKEAWIEIDCLTGTYLDSAGGFGNFNGMARGVGIGWAIVGGESGRKARPMHPDWVRSLRNQCNGAGVPFFFKQWGEYAPTFDVWNNYLDMRKMGKKLAGRLLDGREWNEFPE